MKKVFGILGIFVIGYHSILGNVSLENIKSDDVFYEVLENRGEAEIIYETLSLKEYILNSFEDEVQKERYSIYLIDENKITQGTVAKILCDYLELSPVYLPDKEMCSNPYIGRLVTACIWGKRSYDETAFITLEDWSILFSHAEQFKIDNQYIKKTLEASDLNIKQKIAQYQEQLNRKNNYEKVSIGAITQSHLKVKLNSESYPVYQFLGVSYLSLEELEAMGFQKSSGDSAMQLVWQTPEFRQYQQKELSKQPLYIGTEDIYIGELKTYSLVAQGETYIPVRALQVYFDLNIISNQIVLSPKEYTISDYISCDNNSIINKSRMSLQIQYKDLYWNGTSFIEHLSDWQAVAPGEKLVKNVQLYSLRNGKYLTTIISRLQADGQLIEISHQMGQDAKELFERYEKTVKGQIQLEESVDKELFPASIITGTMKYTVSGLIKGQKVEVWRAEDGVCYYIKDNHNKTVKVPWNSISIPKDPPTAKDKPTKQQIEGFINSQNIDSRTSYLVWTDLYRQQTYIFKGKKNEWQLIKTLLCSTGKNVTPTPRGTFELTNRVPFFGVDKGYRCKNAFQIFGDYLYHSIIFDVTGTRLLEGKGVLGRRASQGCIRFSEEDSLWFYNTMKSQTRVWIN